MLSQLVGEIWGQRWLHSIATARKLDIKLGVILRLWLYIVCKRRILLNC